MKASRKASKQIETYVDDDYNENDYQDNDDDDDEMATIRVPSKKKRDDTSSVVNPEANHGDFDLFVLFSVFKRRQQNHDEFDMFDRNQLLK